MELTKWKRGGGGENRIQYVIKYEEINARRANSWVHI